MNIGKPCRVMRLEPLESPVPVRKPAPEKTPDRVPLRTEAAVQTGAAR